MQKKYLATLVAMLFVTALITGCGNDDDDTSPIPATTLNVLDYGAKGDGTTNDTIAIQKALDDASAKQTTVVFPVGEFMTGALFIKSNTTVQIDEGATLKAINTITNPGNPNAVEYIDTSWPNVLKPEVQAIYPQINTRVQGVEMPWVAAIINIDDAENVTITGKGTIDGQGQPWWDHYYDIGKPQHDKDGVGWALNYDEQRPRALETLNSRNVTIKDITLKNSPFWTMHICYTDGVNIDGIKIRNLMNASGHMPSTDGVDIDSSSNVLVENVDIQANDDAIVVKSGRDGDGLRVNRPSENIVIRNSLVQAGAAGFTIGSETSGGARNIEVYNVQVKPLVAEYASNIGYKKGGPTVYSGFIFKSAPTRGGTMENINIHDMTIDDAYYFLRMEQNWGADNTIPADYPAEKIPPYWTAIMLMPSPAELGTPHFKNFTFKNITMTNVESGVFSVKGTENARYQNFLFDSVNITAVSTQGKRVSGGGIYNADTWTFINSNVRDAQNNPVDVTRDSNTTSKMTGLPNW